MKFCSILLPIRRKFTPSVLCFSQGQGRTWRGCEECNTPQHLRVGPKKSVPTCLLEYYTGGQKELLKLHFLGNEGLQQWFLLTPMPKQSISDNFNVSPTIFDRVPVILSNFYGKVKMYFWFLRRLLFNCQ